MPIEAVVFDLYGTLLYSPDEYRPFHRLFGLLGIPPEQMAQERITVMTENLTTLEAVAKRLRPGVEVDLTACKEELKKKIEATYAFPESLAVLKELQRRGLKIGLISNLSAPYQAPFFDLGLAPYFDEVIFSFAVGFVKPQLEIYDAMIRRLGISSGRVLMTGDKYPKDVEAPRSVGMQAVHLDRTGKSPGSISTLEGIFQYL